MCATYTFPMDFVISYCSVKMYATYGSLMDFVIFHCSVKMCATYGFPTDFVILYCSIKCVEHIPPSKFGTLFLGYLPLYEVK